MKIYELSVKSVNLPLKKESGFLSVIENTGYGQNLFSTYEKAYRKMEELIGQIDTNDELFVGGRIVEREVDDFTNSEKFYYFKLYKHQITNVDQIPNTLKEGDWVIYFEGDSLDCGVIGGISDPSYQEEDPIYVLKESNEENDCSPHSHISLFNVIKIVDDSEAKDFLPNKYYENIKKRHLLNFLKIETYNMSMENLIKKHKK